MTLILEVTDGPEAFENYPRKVELTRSGGIIGRDRDCSLYLPSASKTVSRVHGKIIYENNRFLLEDASVNGIFINNENEPLGRNRKHAFSHGDVMEVGEFTIRVALDQSGLSERPDLSTLTDMESVSTLSKTGKAPSAENKVGVSRSSTDESRQSFTVAKNDLGDIVDQFSPPEIVVPQDWDRDPAHDDKKPNIIPLVNFESRNSKLIDALLEGLGGTDLTRSEQLNPDVLRLFGNSLRTMLEAFIQYREDVRNVKSRLSFDKISPERQLEADPLGHLNTSEQVISVLLDEHHPDHPNLLSQLGKSLNYYGEDINEVLECDKVVFDRFFTDLSPEAITEKLEQKQVDSASDERSLLKINDVFSSGARKWAFFQKNWKKIYAHVNVKIRKDFESKFLLTHVKRMGTKQHAE